MVGNDANTAFMYDIPPSMTYLFIFNNIFITLNRLNYIHKQVSLNGQKINCKKYTDIGIIWTKYRLLNYVYIFKKALDIGLGIWLLDLIKIEISKN